MEAAIAPGSAAPTGTRGETVADLLPRAVESFGSAPAIMFKDAVRPVGGALLRARSARPSGRSRWA